MIRDPKFWLYLLAAVVLAAVVYALLGTIDGAPAENEPTSEPAPPPVPPTMSPR